MCSQLQGNDEVNIFLDMHDLRPYMAAFGETENYEGEGNESVMQTMDTEAALKEKQTALLNDANLHYGNGADGSQNCAVLPNHGGNFFFLFLYHFRKQKLLEEIHFKAFQETFV